MKLIKLSLKFILKGNFFLLLRNTFNLKPILFDIKNTTYANTMSDAFLWRTDNDYKTKFKYTDILNLFFKIKNSWVELHIYSKENKLLKIEKFTNLNISNEFEITSEYLGNIKDYGVFYIFHFTKDNLNDESVKSIILNRCYLGYSKNNHLYSFVHGNTVAKFTKIFPNNKISSDFIKTSLFKNKSYKIQKYFDKFDKNELFFSNPTSKVLNFTVEKKNYKLFPHCTKIVEIKDNIITIKSNCMLLRPTVFSYKNGYYDVHHC